MVFVLVGISLFTLDGFNMLTFDIPININISAETEEEAEDIVAKLMTTEMSKAALQRSVNSWDFIQFVEEDDAPESL